MSKIRNHPAYRPALLAILAAVLAWGMLTGCSGTRRIASGINGIRQHATAILTETDKLTLAAADVKDKTPILDLALAIGVPIAIVAVAFVIGIAWWQLRQMGVLKQVGRMLGKGDTTGATAVLRTLKPGDKGYKAGKGAA